MISPKSITRKDASDGKVTKAIDSYYQEEKDDYYTREKQPSEWYGALAADLELNGSVEKTDFTQMLDGHHKDKILRDSSSKKKSANDRLGMDLTFNAPKSVSIQALVAGDNRLIEAHHEAVKESLAMIEGNAQARKKVAGKTRVENTNNIAVAMFRHDTNRNNDPHLHTHSVVLNITKRGDGAYRALHNDELVKKIPEASQAYQTNLAKKCKELGYDVRLNDNGTFDLAHISREQITQFSTRSKQIEEALAKRGLTRETASKEERQMANFTTKQHKRKIDKNWIQDKWVQAARRMGIESALLPSHALNTQSKEKENVSEKEQIENQLNDKSNRRGAKRDDRDRADDTRSRAADRGSSATQTNSATDKNNDSDSYAKSYTSRSGRSEDATDDRLHELHGSDVASATERSKMLLQNNEQLQLHHGKTNTTRRMRWSRDSSSPSRGLSGLKAKFGFENKQSPQPLDNAQHQSDTKILDDQQQLEDENQYDTLQANSSKDTKESLKDMLEYEAPTTELTQRWRNVAENLELDLEPGKMVNEPNREFSGQKLMSHVVEHLADKKVNMSRPEIIRETLIRGMGEVDHQSANRLLDEFIEQGKIIKAEQLYKTSEDKTTETAKTIDQWKNTLIKNSNLSEEAAIKAIKTDIKHGALLPLEDRYVTKEDLASERTILKIMEDGRNSQKSYMEADTANEILDKTTLNEGQKSAAKLILTTEDRVVGIQGYAGVGKSYTLSQTLPQVEAMGSNVHVFAPYGAQVKSLKEDGHDAHTLAKLLNSQSMQDAINENDLIIVDEAGVIPNKDAEKLLKIAEQRNARVVLLGDIQQTKAINAGKPFDLLQDNKMSLAIIDEIQRQKDETLKKAVSQAAKDQPKQSIQTLSKSVHEVKNKEDRLDMLVTRYMNYSDEERDKTLIVTGTNKDKDYINDHIREAMGVKNAGHETEQLKRVDMSQAEMKHAKYYKEGSLIEVQTKPNNSDLKKGELYKVVGTEKHLLIVENGQGEQIKFNPTRERLSAYESKKMEVSKGDKLKITKGDSEKGTTTGDKLIVETVAKSHFTARDVKTNDVHIFDTKDKNHLDHDYCSTVHSSQGLTVDNVLINIDTKSRTTSKEVYYVAVSRAKKEAIVVTDSISKLPSSIATAAEKYSAHQMVGNEKNNILSTDIDKNKERNLEKQKEELEL
tara:strand:- start:7981 stop:11499 length:3519 start_codon:yes stop_codon:yes gene_type:complete